MKIKTEIGNLSFLWLKSSFTLYNRTNNLVFKKDEISKLMDGLMCIVLASFANLITLIGVDIIIKEHLQLTVCNFICIHSIISPRLLMRKLCATLLLKVKTSRGFCQVNTGYFSRGWTY